jgi:hypothetical protein
MALPKVQINIQNGALGIVPGTADGVAGLVMSGVAVATKIALLEPKQIFSTDDAKALGLDAAYDTANSTKVWKHISDFYAQAGEGAELWIMLVVNTTLMADMCDKANDIAKKLLNAASGRIRLLGIHRIPDGAYEPTYDNELDDDVIDAVATLQALAEDFAAAYKPFRGVIEGRDFQGTVADLYDLRGDSANAVSVILANNEATTGAAIGLVLGRLAKIPVQRNIGRVKDGNLGVSKAYLSDGEELVDSTTGVVNYSDGELATAHDLGYIVMRKYQGKSGFYFADDPTAAPVSDDYGQIGRGRVIDKALVIAYTTYVDELLDEIEIDPATGQINPAVIKSYQGKIANAINTNMINEISGLTVTIDPAQNVLSTSKVKVKLAIVPVGYAKTIEVDLGFSNPALSA